MDLAIASRHQRLSYSAQLVFITICTIVLGSPKCSAQVPKIYRPWIETALVSKAPTILVAKLSRQSKLPSGERMLRFQPLQQLRGHQIAAFLTMRAPDAITQHPKSRKLLFMKSKTQNALPEIVDFVDLDGEEGAMRLQFFERLLKVEAMTSPFKKSVAMKALLLEFRQSPSVWVRRIFIPELANLIAYRASLFQTDDLLKIRKLVLTGLGKAERQQFREQIHRLEEVQALAWSRSRMVFPQEENRAAFLEDLAKFEKSSNSAERIAFVDQATLTFKHPLSPLLMRFISDKDPLVAKRAIYWLGELESGAALGALIALVRNPKSKPALRAASLDALKKIASPRASAPLIALIQAKAPMTAEMLIVLAAINDGQSALFIKDFDARLRKDPKSAAPMRLHLTRIQAPAFQKKLADERQARQKRFRKDGN